MKLQKKIYLTALIYLLTAIFICIPASASKKAESIPKLQIVTQPEKEYEAGETISFSVTSPNYTGTVQYRVILYNGTTKKTTDLWKNPETGNYYTGWQPSGDYCFEIHWPVNQIESGAYSMTVLVRRAGTKASYDSYVDTDTFWVIGNGVSSNTTSSTEIMDITLDESTKYSGETVNGEPEGIGTATYQNGDKYEGQWKNGKKDGKGIYTSANGESHQQEWKDGSIISIDDKALDPLTAEWKDAQFSSEIDKIFNQIPQSEIDKLLDISGNSESSNTDKKLGKTIILNKTQKKVEKELYLKMPAENRAQLNNFAEAQTLVLIEEGHRVVGSYSGTYTQARRRTGTVTVIDMETKTILGSKQFDGGSPPFVITYYQGMAPAFQYGSYPDKDAILQYILSFK